MPKKHFFSINETGRFLCETRGEAKKTVFFINETGRVLCSAMLEETVPVMSEGFYTQYEKTARIAGFLIETQTRDLLDLKHKC